MDNYIDERDYKLLDLDKYTFFVLRRIMGRNVNLLLTDHKKLIICYTEEPFPVWIWTPDDATEQEMEKVYHLAKENQLLLSKCTFNMKYALAEYFIKRAIKDGFSMKISTNMYAYDCLNPIKPIDRVNGNIHLCKPEDLDELVSFMDMFHKEIGLDQKDMQGYRLDAENYIASERMYFWKDEQGNSVASCKYAPNGDMASINLVFTRPEFRRKHYAENLVYQVTMKAKEEGYVPMLYTDADYKASNACYEKIGYVFRGKLCTIG